MGNNPYGVTATPIIIHDVDEACEARIDLNVRKHLQAFVDGLTPRQKSALAGYRWLVGDHKREGRTHLAFVGTLLEAMAHPRVDVQLLEHFPDRRNVEETFKSFQEFVSSLDFTALAGRFFFNTAKHTVMYDGPAYHVSPPLLATGIDINPIRIRRPNGA
jgi:hypothetical protein